MMEKPEDEEPRSVVRGLWKKWKQVGKKIGDIQARLLLVLFYFLVLAPFALAVCFFSDPLAIKGDAGRGWLTRKNRSDSPMKQATMQF